MRPHSALPIRSLSRAFCVGFAFAAAVPQAAHPQALRISGATILRYIEVRPLVRDSIAAEDVEGSALLRYTSDGRVVRCVPGETFCRSAHFGTSVSTVPVIQDLELSAWGFAEGVQLFAHLRGRAAWGSNRDLWPRSGDAFDLLVAYGEFERDRFRLRAGRQWKVSGLGFYNFDGLAATLRPRTGISLEGYVGRSLVRGLNEPRTGGALESVEELAPTAPGLLVGVQARYRPSSRLAVGGLYHLDVRSDRAGLYSELAAADGVMRIGGASLEGSLEVDLSAAELNEVRLRARSAPLHRMILNAEVRRYRPYFELWTIWGAFSPVGFDEARLGLVWATPWDGLLVRGDASYRSYGDTGTAGVGDFRSDGWGLGGNVSWSPDSRWRVEGGYRVEAGFGAARSEGHTGVARQIGTLGSVALRAIAFQRLYEFRLDEGTVVGVGAETALRLTGRTRAVAGVTSYQHLNSDAASGIDWSQLRGNLRIQWTVGTEPRLPGEAGGSR